MESIPCRDVFMSADLKHKFMIVLIFLFDDFGGRVVVNQV